MADISNLYWGFGYTDGLYNFEPDYEGKRYTPEQIKLYCAGYRCGVRDQKKDKAKFHSADRELRAHNYKFPDEK